jgi:hypothetical protein
MRALSGIAIALGDPETRGRVEMKVRTLIVTAGATFALAAPAAQATFDRSLPSHGKAKIAKKVAKAAAKSHRVVCICSTSPVTTQPANDGGDWQAGYDQDLIDHGLTPVYNTDAGT